MYRICLISMPFANLTTPSIALTQLRSVTQARFPGRVSLEILYLTHDFGQYLGVDIYTYVANSMEALNAGFGEWFFRAVAFPELPDNTDSYLRRFYHRKIAWSDRIKHLVALKRPKLDEYMESLIARYDLDTADLVGFTSMFMQNVASFAMARKLKRRNPRLITILGGANCEFPMGKVIAQRVADIDFVFSGPALKSFPDFVQRCLDGDVSRRSSRGVFSKDVGATVPVEQAFGEDVSIDVPIPLDYDDFLRRYEAYFSTTHVPADLPDTLFRPLVPIETSRGCWWGQHAHCTFCGLNGETMAYRAMKPALAIEQFKSAFRYSGKAPLIQAVDNILPKHYIDEVLPFLDTPKDMKIFYEVKADLSQRELAILANARVVMIQPGIESLATSTLKLMRKGTTAFQNICFLKHCTTYGLKPSWNLLIGFPGEGADVYRRYVDILPLLTHLPPPLGVFPVRFDRFSPYHKQAASYGLDLRPMSFYASVYPFDQADLEDFAYYFADHNWKAGYFQAMAEWIPRLQPLIADWQARWSSRSPDATPPALFFKDGSDVVHDSRRGRVTEQAIGPLGKAMLLHAMRPLRIDTLIRAFSATHGAEASRMLSVLEEAGFILREGDHALSLILSPEEDAEHDARAASDESPTASAGRRRPASGVGHTKFWPIVAS